MHARLQRWAVLLAALRQRPRGAFEETRAWNRIGVGVGFALIVGIEALLADGFDHRSLIQMGTSGGYAVLGLLHLRWLRGDPARGFAVQQVLIVADAVLLMAIIAFLPPSLLSLFPLVMLLLVRLALQYGMPALWLSWGTSSLMALWLLPGQPVWMAEFWVLHALGVMLATVPIFMAPMVRKLDSQQAQLREAATTDALTGAANRRGLESLLGSTLRRSAEDGRALALLAFDLDHFKRVNDVHGHARGDALLVQVAETLRRRCRAGDLVARLGGDEFVVVLVGLPADGGLGHAQRRADLLVQAVGEIGERLAPGEGVGASVGVAGWVPGQSPMPDGETLMRRADEALYAAKRAGRARSALAAVA